MVSALTRRRSDLEPFSLLVEIRGTNYRIERLDPHPDVAKLAYRLAKQGGDEAVYDVHTDRYGPHCDCPGHTRWQTPCKHIRALARAGMIEPVAEPTVRRRTA